MTSVNEHEFGYCQKSAKSVGGVWSSSFNFGNRESFIPASIRREPTQHQALIRPGTGFSEERRPGPQDAHVVGRDRRARNRRDCPGHYIPGQCRGEELGGEGRGGREVASGSVRKGYFLYFLTHFNVAVRENARKTFRALRIACGWSQ